MRTLDTPIVSLLPRRAQEQMMAVRPTLSEKEQAAREQARDAIFKAAPERFTLLFHVKPSPFDVISSPALAAMFAGTNTLDVPTQPMPATVKQQLRDYSLALFDAESKYYSERTEDAEELRLWLEDLAREIAAQVRPIAAKSQLDEHCPASQRLAAVNDSLATRVRELVDHKTSQGHRLIPVPQTAPTIPATPNPWAIWETNRNLPDATATLRLHAACKTFREKIDSHILQNKELWRTVEVKFVPGQTSSHGKPDPDAMLGAFCKHCTWFLGEVSEAFIDHIVRRGLLGTAGIDAFTDYARQFTSQALQNNWEWGLGHLGIANVDETIWIDLSDGVRARKVEQLQALWLPEDSSRPTTLIENKQDRQQLKKTYLEAFRPVMLLDICWSARQHYSEWKRWLRYAVKDDSAPDKAFRAILTSGKRPSEYRRDPRPDGWK